MPVSVEETDNDSVVIHVSGRFDYSIHSQFLSAYESFPKGEECFIVDLKDAEYMDSSAMGMLLQLREHSDKAAGGVTIRNSSEAIKDVLRIANFHRLFTIV